MGRNCIHCGARTSREDGEFVEVDGTIGVACGTCQDVADAATDAEPTEVTTKYEV